MRRTRKSEYEIPAGGAAAPSATARDAMRRLLREKLRREMEGLRLYEPLPLQDGFHRSLASERVVRGSNRAGKTLCAAAECARAVTGQDPHGKYPARDGRAIFVAKSQKEIAEVFYHKLFRKGAFKVIRDAKSGEWRAYRPHDPADLRRASEAKLSQPLIPKRFIKKIAWEDKARMVPAVVRLTTGWTIHFLTAGSPPPQGVDVDLCWFDEEVTGQGWYSEIAARLVDRKGRFIWSATPQNATEDLFDLSQRASDAEDTDVEEFFVKLDDNPHIEETEKQKLKNKYKYKPDEYRVRIEGEFAVVGFRVYPHFSKLIHGCEMELIAGRNDAGELIEKAQEEQWLTRWNHYMIVDPGRQVCAVLFMAVPPPEFAYADQRFFYDELYLTNCTAARFAAAVKRKVEGKYFMEFIIDPSASKCDISTGLSTAAQYSEALAHLGVASFRTGNSFTMGINAKGPGIEKVTSWLDVSPATGMPRLRVVNSRMQHFIDEIDRYHKKRIHGVLIDDPVDKNDHLMDAARYAAMRDPAWTPQPEAPRPRGYVSRYLERRDAQRRERDGDSYHNFGPARVA